MVQKSFAISVLTAIVVAGILTMSVLVGILSTKQAFAQMTSTSLTLGAFPNKGKVGSTDTLRVSLSGKLTSEGSPVDAATIHITGTGEGKQSTVTTNEFGSFSTSADLAPGTHEIHAYFPGDATHTSSSATRTVTAASPSQAVGEEGNGAPPIEQGAAPSGESAGGGSGDHSGSGGDHSGGGGNNEGDGGGN